jgi:hypothetical protein
LDAPDSNHVLAGSQIDASYVGFDAVIPCLLYVERYNGCSGEHSGGGVPILPRRAHIIVHTSSIQEFFCLGLQAWLKYSSASRQSIWHL